MASKKWLFRLLAPSKSDIGKHFVLLAMPRTGSNMLVSLLDAHPEIDCFGELLRPTPDWMRREGYRGALRCLEHVDPKYQDDAIRFDRPQDFIEDVVETLAKNTTVGFKLMLGQHPEYLNKIIGDASFTKILLYRANSLAAYSSGRIAQATGQGSAHTGTKIRRATVTFDEDDFLRYTAFRDRHYDAVRQNLKASNEPYFEVEYLDLLNNDAVSNLLEFLGADASVALQPQTVKRNSRNLLDRFTNPDEVQRVLAAMGVEHWAVEGHSPACPTGVTG